MGAGSKLVEVEYLPVAAYDELCDRLTGMDSMLTTNAIDAFASRLLGLPVPSARPKSSTAFPAPPPAEETTL